MLRAEMRYTRSAMTARRSKAATKRTAHRAPHRLTAEDRAKVFRALADPSRVNIVDMLTKYGPLCGTELAERLGISLALLCHHWQVLVDAGLVHKDRVGQARYCTIDRARLRMATTGWGGEPPGLFRSLRRKGAPSDNGSG
jgi:DNA-binding transcriptional ArsR family regulator